MRRFLRHWVRLRLRQRMHGILRDVLLGLRKHLRRGLWKWMLRRLRLQLLGRMPGKLRLRVRIGLYGNLRQHLQIGLRNRMQRLRE